MTKVDIEIRLKELDVAIPEMHKKVKQESDYRGKFTLQKFLSALYKEKDALTDAYKSAV